MRVIGYVRGSTDRQSITLEEQERQIRAYCSLYSLAPLEIVSEQASGRSLARRRGLQKALRGRGPYTLVVYSLDRLTRSVRDLYELIDEHFGPSSKNALVSVSEKLDTSSPGGRMVIGILGVVSQWEREAIADRTTRALGNLRQQGRRWSNRAPLGYRWTEDGGIEEDPEAFRLLTRATALRAGGLTLDQVGDELVREGFFPKRPSRSWIGVLCKRGVELGLATTTATTTKEETEDD